MINVTVPLARIALISKVIPSPSKEPSIRMRRTRPAIDALAYKAAEIVSVSGSIEPSSYKDGLYGAYSSTNSMVYTTYLEDTKESNATLPLGGETGHRQVGSTHVTCSGRGIVCRNDDAILTNDKILQEFDKH